MSDTERPDRTRILQPGSDQGIPPVPESAGLHVVGAAIVQDGRCLVTQRGPGMTMPGLWEFPGGKVEAGEDPRHALRREIVEELGVEIVPGHWLGRGFGRVGGSILCLDVFLALLTEERSLRLREHSSHGWFEPSELSSLAWPEADRPLLAPLRRYLLEESHR